MKTILCSVLVLLLFSCNGQQQGKKNAAGTKNSKQIKVASYNVEYSAKGTAREIGEALKSFDFDIVCFSEAPAGNWTKEVAKVLSMDYAVVGRYSTAGHKDKYKSIASKTPLYGYEEILMADTLHTVTKALTKISGEEIAIYSVHFPFGWRDQAHIDETTGKVTAFVNYLTAHLPSEVPVIMGDFNFIPTNTEFRSPYYEMFIGLGLEVTWTKLETDVLSRNTTVGSNPERRRTGRVIDHIMYDPKKMQVLEGEIIEMQRPLSDHKPVWALLQF